MPPPLALGLEGLIEATSNSSRGESVLSWQNPFTAAKAKTVTSLADLAECFSAVMTLYPPVLILRRLLGVINDIKLYGTLLRFQFQAELFLKRGKERRARRVRGGRAALRCGVRPP